jgi:hypothetical protein
MPKEKEGDSIKGRERDEPLDALQQRGGRKSGTFGMRCNREAIDR